MHDVHWKYAIEQFYLVNVWGAIHENRTAFVLVLVAAFIRDAIFKGRQLIDCEFGDIRRIWDSHPMGSCFDEEVGAERKDKVIQDMWREAQCKLDEVMTMMDQVDRLRSNGWRW